MPNNNTVNSQEVQGNFCFTWKGFRIPAQWGSAFLMLQGRCCEKGSGWWRCKREPESHWIVEKEAGENVCGGEMYQK